MIINYYEYLPKHIILKLCRLTLNLGTSGLLHIVTLIINFQGVENKRSNQRPGSKGPYNTTKTSQHMVTLANVIESSAPALI